MIRWLYFISFLHQTTTLSYKPIRRVWLYFLYFLHQTTTLWRKTNYLLCCISFLYYIKPQLNVEENSIANVVFHFFSTSNHNCEIMTLWYAVLYFISFLHQTTTKGMRACKACTLYFISFLHQTTTKGTLFLHQCSCISFLFYIKPQQNLVNRIKHKVVFHFFSTSNHNHGCRPQCRNTVVFHFFSTSNHNSLSIISSLCLVVFHFFSTSNHNCIFHSLNG